MRDQFLPSTAEISLSESLDLSLSDCEGDSACDPENAASSAASLSSTGNAAHMRAGSSAASAVLHTPVRGASGLEHTLTGRGGGAAASVRVEAGILGAPGTAGTRTEQAASSRVPPTPPKPTLLHSGVAGGAGWRYSGEKEKGKERERSDRGLDRERYRERKRVHSVQDASPSALSPDNGDAVRGGAGVRVQDGRDGVRVFACSKVRVFACSNVCTLFSRRGREKYKPFIAVCMRMLIDVREGAHGRACMGLCRLAVSFGPMMVPATRCVYIIYQPCCL